MKKPFIAFSVLLAILVLCLGTFSASASVTVDGYTYNLTATESACLVGWDNSSQILVVPDAIGRYYVTEIGNSAFYQDDYINELDLSEANHLRKIGMFAFGGCVLEGEITIPPRVTEVGISAFDSCAQLNQVSYSAGNGVVPAQCFQNCTSLQFVSLTDYINRIDRNAFANCIALERVDIPKTVHTISSTSFSGCTNLTLGVWYDSYGYQYAKDNNIPYVFLDDYTPGDVNLDGVVDVTDVTYVQQYAADLTEFNDLQLSLADLTGDDIIDISDATKIQRIAADME